ncbi:DUF4363 family protein [Christensenellaceae bacterium OttesenSCG-928-M15]|nr:DUF4363 family protein [Christensenellaceae bacterium OttesenSCG-928-M15]
MARRISIIICVLFLLALFIFPSHFLSGICDEIESLAQQAIEMVFDENFEAGYELGGKINEIYDEHRDFLHVFLSHTGLESLESSIRGIKRLMAVEDKPQTLLELEYIITHVRYLKSIEEFAVDTVL